MVEQGRDDLLRDWAYFSKTGITGINPMTLIPGTTVGQMKGLLFKADLRFYSRPTHWIRILRQIESLSELRNYLSGGRGLLRRVGVLAKKSLLGV